MADYEGPKPEHVEQAAETGELLPRVRGLIWTGFELSQGNNKSLLLLWQWVHKKSPNLKVSKPLQARILENLKPPVSKMLLSGQNNPNVHTAKYKGNSLIKTFKLTPKFVEETLETQVENFAEIMDGKEFYPYNEANFKDMLFFTMMHSDTGFIVTGDGRPGDPQKKDIWDSYVVRYILSKDPKRTNYIEYDSLLDELTREKDMLVQKHKKMLEPVVNAYNSHHDIKISI